MNDIINFNRQTLSSVKNWINYEDYISPPSLFNYGLPNRVYHLINLNISDELTECDIICFIINNFIKDKKQINYLEIGCSVGKTFYQISKYISENTNEFSINCLEIESINPILNDLLTKLMQNSQFNNIETNANVDSDKCCGFVKDKNNILNWRNENRSITYYESNEFDKDIWKNMNIKYNIIFSDAYHEPHALIDEYLNLKNNNLIDFNKFFYCFDDLDSDMNNGKMWESVKYIFNDLKLLTGQTLFIKHFTVNGWLGNNEEKHNFGVISNFDFSLL